jgi:hypothetical protein
MTEAQFFDLGIGATIMETSQGVRIVEVAGNDSVIDLSKITIV